jgi:hypothetical protein
MHSNQSWPPVISPLGVYPCFRKATRAKQGCCRGWQGHTDFLSKIVTIATIEVVCAFQQVLTGLFIERLTHETKYRIPKSLPLSTKESEGFLLEAKPSSI